MPVVIKGGFDQQRFAHEPKGLHETDLEGIRLEPEQDDVVHSTHWPRQVDGPTAKGRIQGVRRRPQGVARGLASRQQFVRARHREGRRGASARADSGWDVAYR